MRRVTAEAVMAAVGLALVALAIVTNQQWLDQHLWPSFFLTRRWYVFLESSARIGLVVSGLVLVFVARPPIGRVAARRPARLVAAVVACVLAVGAAHLVLGWTRPSTNWLFAGVEPLRRVDPRLGWTFVPGRIGRKTVGGRTIEFAFDAAGYRVRNLEEPVDPARPTLLFIGESVMAGEGLNWEETIPAQAGALLGIQSANLAVHGFATDQSYLRLEAELPRFRQPVAVVALFMTALFGRNLDDDRPHLGPGMEWMPAVEHGRLASLAKLIVPFRRDRTVERGVRATREVLRATMTLSTSRGATPLVVVPQFNHEGDAERAMRRRVLDDASLPYVFVEFDADWRLPGDLHPNAITTRKIAAAIASQLRVALRQ
jgi:hypothetical protein